MSDSVSTSFAQPTPHPAKSSLPMLYYGLVVVATAAIVLILYKFIIIKWCSDSHHGGASPALAAVSYAGMVNSSRTFRNSGSFKFKKGSTAAMAEQEHEKGNECVVCLSAFEDGEEVKKLPRCTHMFHALCIDMWLHSHSDCPLCRAPVAAPGLCQRHSTAEQLENSRHGLLESGNLV